MSTYGIEQSVASWYGALVMGMIAAMSIYMVAVVIVRIIFFRRTRVNVQSLLEHVRQALADNDAKALSEIGGDLPSDPPVKILLHVALANRDLDANELNEYIRITQVRQRERLTRGLSVFGTFATIGPFIGLFATVLGIIESFHGLAQTGAQGPNVVASGVAAALWGTAAGLALAIPSVVAYNIFNKMAKTTMTEMEIVSREIVLLLKLKHPRKAAARG